MLAVRAKKGWRGAKKFAKNVIVPGARNQEAATRKPITLDASPNHYLMKAMKKNLLGRMKQRI